YLTLHIKKRPYIFLKFAKSLDGLINSTCLFYKKPFYISNTHSLQHVHYRRTQEQAIIIGKNTAIQDNPKLDTRLVGGVIFPYKIILDSNLESLNFNLNLFKKKNKLWIYNVKKNLNIYNVNCIKVDKKNFLKNVLHDLYKKNIHSVIVE
ncbi:RibD family protein, partial [Paraburkholderia azotifigens]